MVRDELEEGMKDHYQSIYIYIYMCVCLCVYVYFLNDK